MVDKSKIRGKPKLLARKDHHPLLECIAPLLQGCGAEAYLASGQSHIPAIVN